MCESSRKLWESAMPLDPFQKEPFHNILNLISKIAEDKVEEIIPANPLEELVVKTWTSDDAKFFMYATKNLVIFPRDDLSMKELNRYCWLISPMYDIVPIYRAKMC